MAIRGISHIPLQKEKSCFLSVPVLQWNSYPHFLIHIHAKSMGTQSSRMLCKLCEIANPYSHKYLFTVEHWLWKKTKNLLRATPFGYWLFHKGVLYDNYIRAYSWKQRQHPIVSQNDDFIYITPYKNEYFKEKWCIFCLYFVGQHPITRHYFYIK